MYHYLQDQPTLVIIHFYWRLINSWVNYSIGIYANYNRADLSGDLQPTMSRKNKIGIFKTTDLVFICQQFAFESIIHRFSSQI